ncbi:MAG: hypothetical protein R2783_02420 [Gelidibacter sp.]
MKTNSILILFALLIFSCSSKDDGPAEEELNTMVTITLNGGTSNPITLMPRNIELSQGCFILELNASDFQNESISISFFNLHFDWITDEGQSNFSYNGPSGQDVNNADIIIDNIRYHSTDFSYSLTRKTQGSDNCSGLQGAVLDGEFTFTLVPNSGSNPPIQVNGTFSDVKVSLLCGC